MTYQATILDDGTLLFPAEVGRALGLVPRDAVTLAIDKAGVRVDRISLLEQSLRRIMRAPRVAAQVGAFLADRQEDARRENDRLGMSDR